MRCTVVSRTRRNFELNFDHHNYNLYFILLPRAVQRTFKVLHHYCTRWEFIFVRHTCMRTALYAVFFANFVSDFVFDEKEKNIRNSERATWGARGRILRFTHHTPNKVIPVFTVITNTTNKKRYLPPMIR